MPSAPAGQPDHAPGGQTPFEALWRTREYLRRYYWQLGLMLLAAFAAVATEIIIPLLTKAVIDGPIAHGERHLLIPLGAAALGLGAAQAVLNLLRRWGMSRAVTSMERDMRDDLYAHLQRLDAGFHSSWQSGQLLSRATTDLSAIRRFAGFGTIFFITNVMTFFTVVGLLIHLNWWLGLVTGGVCLPVVWACGRFERRYRVLSRLSQDQQGDLATYVEEAVAGIRVLKALGRRDEAAARHGAQARLAYETQIGKASLRGTFWAGLDLIPNIMIGLILMLGALAASRGELTLGGLVAFITLTLQLVWPIESMGYILASGQEAATAAQRIYEILDTESTITDPAVPVPGATPRLRPGGGGPAPAPARHPGPAASLTVAARPGTGPEDQASTAGAGQLTFDRVAFTYPGAEHPVLRDVSLVLAPGETVALVGATGTGKTTLLNLVPRLADVSDGAVRLDGVDVRELPLPLLRSRVGSAFEDPTLFSASVRENVSFGSEGAGEDEVEAALTVAQAGFVYGLPWGLDTRIGEQGMALSGGQRQRVALARAILAKPSVLILDDPLSALDVNTEAKVTAALSQVLAASTALIVAHRPSTVLLADRVALLDHGTIAAIGTHRELLARHPGYRNLMSAAPRPTAGDDDAGRQDLTGARR
ncbi:MAG: ABC transporter ATP-binding protein [Actinomycetota bacterium]